MTENALAQTTTTARSVPCADAVDCLTASAESICGVKRAATAFCENDAVRRYDAIVVGAGPAGSTCAYRLAGAGPRCSCSTVRASRATSRAAAGSRAVRRSSCPSRSRRSSRTRSPSCACGSGTGRGSSAGRGSRSCSDPAASARRLPGRAGRPSRRGARDGVKVTAVQGRRTGSRSRPAASVVRAEALVGADGVNGVCAGTLGLGGNQPSGSRWRGTCPGEARRRVPGLRRARARARPGRLRLGLPEGDHANFGIGGWEREDRGLRACLRELCAAHGVAAGDLESVRGYRLPLRSRARRSRAAGRP